MQLTNQAQKQRALKTIPLFEGLPNTDLRAIARHCSEETFPEGAVIAREDTHGVRMLLILDGEVVIEKRGQPIASLGPGEVVGEMSLIDGERRSATITAKTPVTALALYRSHFTELVKQTHSLPVKLMVALSHRLRETDEELLRRN